VKLHACLYNVKGGDIYDFHGLLSQSTLRQVTCFFMLRVRYKVLYHF
jgi:hypothetical protein